MDENPSENPEHNSLLPIANISRIMKKGLPPNAKLSKEAKQTVQECVSEFISFITSEACERCMSDKRKTLNCEDLLHALNILGFDRYIDILQTYLHKLREGSKNERPTVLAHNDEDTADRNEDYNEDDIVDVLAS